MLECLILGDSIAVGIGQVRPECRTVAHSGINSRVYNEAYGNIVSLSENTIISLGSNDLAKLHTEVELVALRTKIVKGRVFWIVPANKPEKQQIVRDVARAFGDIAIEIPEISADGVHPTYRGYKKLGEMTR